MKYELIYIWHYIGPNYVSILFQLLDHFCLVKKEIQLIRYLIRLFIY